MYILVYILVYISCIYSPSLVANLGILDFGLQTFGSKLFHSYYWKEAGFFYCLNYMFAV